MIVPTSMLLLLSTSPAFASGAEPSKPHVLMLLADDYGWANFGVHRRDGEDSAEARQARAEVHTPNLNALADAGILLERHYAFSVCAPSRSALQTGRLSVHVNVVNTDMTTFNYSDPMSGSAGIPRNMTGVAQKLRGAGYRTHAVGKWGVGSATPEHTPHGRGYETWIGYYGHSNEYWRKTQPFVSTGSLDSCANRFVDFSMHNETYRGGVLDAASLSHACEEDHESDPACYEEHIFKERAISVINEHDISNREAPLFLFYAFHLVHSPLEVPLAYLSKIDRLVSDAGGVPFSSMNRRHYAAMTLYLDDAIGEVIQAVKAKDGMWEDTLVIFITDNGGAVYEPGAANNHPLKGGKYSDWEGGIRTNAFVSGGVVPPEKRGSKHLGVVSNADWYGTLCALAGVDPVDHAAADANWWLQENKLPLLPAVDSVAQWDFLVNGSNGRPDPLHISEHALLHWPFKLITGRQVYSAWQGALYPNCSTVQSSGSNHGPSFVDISVLGSTIHLQDDLLWMQDCGAGCLFNIDADPTEHRDIASDPAHQSTLEAMQLALEARNKKLFKPLRGTGSVDACKAFIDNGGYYGPFVDIEGWYSPRQSQSITQRAMDSALKAFEMGFNHGVVKAAVRGFFRAALWTLESTNIGVPAFDKCWGNATEVSPTVVVV